MASFAPMRQACAGTTPFEVGVRPRCSRNRSQRGRPQQCARSAARTSSSRFASRGSSPAASGSRRPSSDVELRGDLQSIIAAPTASVFDVDEDKCATGFVSGVINIAMDDVATEIDYFTDDETLLSPSSTTAPKTSFWVCDAQQVLSTAEPTIAEESEDNEEDSSALPLDIICCVSDCEEMDDDLVSCHFDDDVCSVDDEMLMATTFAENAVSNDMIREALTLDDITQEAHETKEEQCDYASGILCGAMEGIKFEQLSQDDEMSAIDSEEELVVDFLGETPTYGEELAFDFASSILDVAIVQASTTWKAQEKVESSPPDPFAQAVAKQSSLEDIKERAKRALLTAALEKASPMGKMIKHIETLKQTARDCLLKAAQERTQGSAPEVTQVVQEQEPEAVPKDMPDDLRRRVQDTLLKASASGQLQRALGDLMQKTKPQAILLNDGNSESLCQDMPTPSKERTLHSSRSRRRIIGGVVRAPAAAFDMDVTPSSPQKSSKSSRKSLQGPTSFRMDAGEDVSSARASSLTRNYHTLGVQFHSLADADELPYASEAVSSRKPSKAKAKMRAASMSAMAMDLNSGPSSASSFSPTFSTFYASYTPSPVNVDKMMRTSASMGSLNLESKGTVSFKLKQAPSGLLPNLAADENSAESIAWSMQVSKTPSKWHNTGLRGSASMIF